MGEKLPSRVIALGLVVPRVIVPLGCCSRGSCPRTPRGYRQVIDTELRGKPASLSDLWKICYRSSMYLITLTADAIVTLSNAILNHVKQVTNYLLLFT